MKGHTWCCDQGVALRPPACAARPPRPRARAARPPRPRGPPRAPGQAGLHSCDAARADGGWSARPARRRGRPQHEGPAQAAHAAEGEEEVVALSKFMCARHACGAAGRRPPCSARSAQLPKPCTQVRVLLPVEDEVRTPELCRRGKSAIADATDSTLHSDILSFRLPSGSMTGNDVHSRSFSFSFSLREKRRRILRRASREALPASCGSRLRCQAPLNIIEFNDCRPFCGVPAALPLDVPCHSIQQKS